MATKSSCNKESASRDARTARKRYQRPELKTYGHVKDLTRATSGSVGDAGSMMRDMVSDRRLKENVVRIGDHRLGIGLYLFDYRPEHQSRYGYERQFGVMADEVEAVMPEAVSVNAEGYKVVEYAMLGIFPAH